MPIVSDKIPQVCKNLKAGNIMNSDVVTVYCVDKMTNV